MATPSITRVAQRDAAARPGRPTRLPARGENPQTGAVAPARLAEVPDIARAGNIVVKPESRYGKGSEQCMCLLFPAHRSLDVSGRSRH